MRTQVGIVGAGPAGLVLGHLLHQLGVESVVLEDRSREYVEQRVRAGVLEQGTVDLLAEMRVDERMRREGQRHEGIELRFDRGGHRIALSELTGGRAIWIYGQQEVVKDLIRARLDFGGETLFEVEDVTVEDIDSERPGVRFRHQGEEKRIDCDVIAGCDGYHGVCRDAIPAGVLKPFERDLGFGWLGILAEVAPSTHELIYANHERGFALHSMRSPELSRLYLQCDPDDDVDNWPDDRIWEELQARLAVDGDWTLREGPIVEKGITPHRCFLVEPMQYGRLFLAGDAAHIVPATGAKGLNLAVADVHVLADALATWYRTGDEDPLRSYSDTCLRRVWRVQHFSWWMTLMLHKHGDEFDARLQRSQLRYVTSSRAAATSLAENYVGLEHERAALRARPAAAGARSRAGRSGPMGSASAAGALGV